jgi:hypothetical protein
MLYSTSTENIAMLNEAYFRAVSNELMEISTLSNVGEVYPSLANLRRVRARILALVEKLDETLDK